MVASVMSETHAYDLHLHGEKTFTVICVCFVVVSNQDLHAAEFFSGTAQLSAALAADGSNVASVDLNGQRLFLILSCGADSVMPTVCMHGSVLHVLE